MHRLPPPARIAAMERAFQAGDGPRCAELVLSSLRAGFGGALDALAGHPLEDDWRDLVALSARAHLAASRGHVYVAGNPMQPEFLKVGKTGRTPAERLAELNNEAVVGEFLLVASWEVADRHHGERAAHRALAGYARKKEFFRAPWKPLCAAVAAALDEDRARLARAGLLPHEPCALPG